MQTLLLYAFKYLHLNAAFEVGYSDYRLSKSRTFGRSLEFRITSTVVYDLTVFWTCLITSHSYTVAYPEIFSGWVQQIQLRTEVRGQRECGSGGGSPQGFRSIFKWMKPVFLLGCYRYIFHGTENSAQLCQNFAISGGGGGVNSPTPLGTPLFL
jgi:hypothetical protein